MPIARKIDKDTLKDFSSQMKTNFTKTTTVVEEEPPVLRQAQQPQTVAVPEPVEGQQQISTQPPKAFETTPASALTPKTDKYADVMNIRLSKGRRNEIKAFCSSNGVTVTQFIESSYEFLAREVAAGNISISKGGISKKII
ncbi:MAG: hypothetical protein J5687_00330 [Treponema sp.]|nr:hypothetical protein [Treponema sp.]